MPGKKMFSGKLSYKAASFKRREKKRERKRKDCIGEGCYSESNLTT